MYLLFPFHHHLTAAYMLSLRTSGPLHALVSINKLLNNEIIGTCAKNNGLDFYKVYV
jgi:hypothetical protein